MIIVSIDVTFHENTFPYIGLQNDPISCCLPQVDAGIDEKTIDSTETNTDIDGNFNTEDSHEEENTKTAANHNEVLRRSTRITSRPARLEDYICSNISEHTHIPIKSPSPSTHACFVSACCLPQEPKTYAEAIKKEEWRNAMNTELEALEKNQTWEITKLPKHKRVIGCKWIFKLKIKPDGSIERHKARLVAKGYNQIEGIDYIDSFSPVAKADLSEHIISEIKYYLDTLFTIKDLGQARFFLGLEIARTTEGISLTQTKYIKDIVEDAGFSQAKAATTPFHAGTKLVACEGERLTDPEQYRTLLGRLLYLGFSRPDICYAMQQLIQFMQHPRKGQWNATLNIVK
ncbi:UNVERIFIED_CONTAM: Retrovirus-related Pol polyprotein from transposon RE1 [Sesamum indicum]